MLKVFLDLFRKIKLLAEFAYQLGNLKTIRNTENQGLITSGDLDLDRNLIGHVGLFTILMTKLFVILFKILMPTQNTFAFLNANCWISFSWKNISHLKLPTPREKMLISEYFGGGFSTGHPLSHKTQPQGQKRKKENLCGFVCKNN